MRAAALAVISVVALAACSPSGGSASHGGASSASSGSASNGFPTGTGVSYKQEATMSIAGQTIPEVFYHDGGKVRTEMSGAMGNTVMVVNNDTHEGFTVATMMGRTIATRMDLTQPQANQDQIAQMRAQMKNRAHQVGACSAAGENGTEWEMTPPAGTDTSASTQQRSMCLTSDGILLQMKMNGAVVFNTTSIQRGPQDASLFEPPAGVHFSEVHAPSQAEINDIVARAKAAAGKH
jgi:hypothetical protein